MEKQMVVVLVIHADAEQHDGLAKSLDHWKHTAEGAYAAHIRVEIVEPK